ncbi:hypothetical protein [Helicobacter pylori]|uniref:hypothetical protein n=1 Tax=Helicobacter pylori TaxID=210 RepID=UPI001E32679B|nr:hypothetical protein [Helicobacter pylori]
MGNEKSKLDPRDERIEELEKEKRELEGIRAQREIIKQNLATLSTHNKALEAEFNQLDEKFENLKNRYAGVEDFEKRQKKYQRTNCKNQPQRLRRAFKQSGRISVLRAHRKGHARVQCFLS